MKVYKKVRRLSDGNYYPLFIDKSKKFTFGEWMHCEYHPTKGYKPRSVGNDENGNPLGCWHACFTPIAPHISDELKSGEKRIWIECEAKGLMKTYDRPESQGGTWTLVEWIKPLRVLNESEVKEITGE